MDIWTSVALTVGGCIVTVILKFSESRFAIAKEKFQHRLLAYEQISLHAFHLASAGLVDPNNEGAKQMGEESFRSLHKQLFASLPLLPKRIFDQVSDILTKHTDVTKPGVPQDERDKLVGMALQLLKTIKSELGAGKEIPTIERLLLGTKKVA